MRWFGLIVGAVVVLASAISFAAPELRLSLERTMITPIGLDAIAIVRIAIGVGLVFCASASRAPRTLRALGLLVIVAGLATPWFGVVRAQAAVNWFEAAGSGVKHAAAALGMALGALLIYLFRAPTRPAA